MLMEADGNPTNLRHCTVPGCRRKFYARGLCQKHYSQARLEGFPEGWTPPRPKRRTTLPTLRRPRSRTGWWVPPAE